MLENSKMDTTRTTIRNYFSLESYNKLSSNLQLIFISVKSYHSEFLFFAPCIPTKYSEVKNKIGPYFNDYKKLLY